MVPRIMASTPSTLPSLAAVTGSVRSLLVRFCSARSLSMALRSITLTLPSCTSLVIRRSAAAFPRLGALISTKGSFMPPWTAALSKSKTATRFFGLWPHPDTAARASIVDHTTTRIPEPLGHHYSVGSGGVNSWDVTPTIIVRILTGERLIEVPFDGERNITLSEKEKMLAGELYRSTGSELQAAMAEARQHLRRLNAIPNGGMGLVEQAVESHVSNTAKRGAPVGMAIL